MRGAVHPAWGSGSCGIGWTRWTARWPSRACPAPGPPCGSGCHCGRSLPPAPEHGLPRRRRRRRSHECRAHDGARAAASASRRWRRASPMLAAAFVPTGAPAVAARATSTLTFAAPTPTPTPSTLAARAALAQTIGPGAIVESERPSGGAAMGGEPRRHAERPQRRSARGTSRWGSSATTSTPSVSRRPTSICSRSADDYVDILGTHHLSWVRGRERDPVLRGGAEGRGRAPTDR